MELIQFIIEPLQYAFMVKAVLVSMVVGATCAVLSCFLILKGWSLLGDAISHAVLPGVVIAYLIGIPFSIGAFVFALLAVVLIGFIKTNTKIKEDAVMGIVFTTLFALGLIMISKVTSSVDLTHVLFGYVLGISDQAAWYTIGVLAIVTAVVLAFRRTFLVFCFDPTHAQSVGLPMRFVNYAFLVLLAVTITGSLQTVGIILVIAMLITPGSTAFLLTRKFNSMVQIAVLVSVLSSVVGAYASYYFDISTGGAIVFMQGLIFLGVLFYHIGKTKMGNRLTSKGV
ncbi:MAG: metal ABC transporter permease [Candidatus Nomurabacteria bacterium]|nr:metal ABC transporter permease [Candidatus Nomurabacteria bacterium]USN88236.1 MAG: metal ABC transporter permease [Candidatus Nomurabacteria bacterium]